MTSSEADARGDRSVDEHVSTDTSHGGPAEASSADQGLPLVDRSRPPRRRLIPKSTIAAIGGVVVTLVLIVGAGVWYTTTQRVSVPDLIGLAEGVARTQLAREGLHISSVERRFDESPAGTVLSQDPVEGSIVSRGRGVALVVSGGTEEFQMPDVTGLSINVARAQLEQRGLVVRIEAVPSEEASDIVLETIPAPGATVRTSDIVRMRIAAAGTATGALLPFELQDRVFVLDPAPGLPGEVDASLEVVRRLRSLLEASGARVVVTRSVTETEVALATRVQRAAETTVGVTAFLSIEAVSDPPGGLAVIDLDGLPAGSPARRLSDEVANALGQDERPVLRSPVVTDPLLEAIAAPSVRVRIGSYGVPEDAAAFRDPTWSDTIARSIYRALGERFSEQ